MKLESQIVEQVAETLARLEPGIKTRSHKKNPDARPGWTLAQDDILETMWTKGLSARDIAEALGMTRNAVIGRAHRKGLSKHTGWTKKDVDPNKPKRKRRSPFPRNPFDSKFNPASPLYGASVSPAVPLWVRPDKPLVCFTDLEDHHCRWPIGEPKAPDFGFCGEEKWRGGPYCQGHHRISFVPAKRPLTGLSSLLSTKPTATSS